MGILKTARQALRSISPTWLNVNVDRNFFQNLQNALKPAPRVMTVEVTRQGRPHWRRISAVYAALDQCWAIQGEATYDRLLSHVAEVTGQKCSRKLIAKWKLERGLR
jgi:hypothetical protein